MTYDNPQDIAIVKLKPWARSPTITSELPKIGFPTEAAYAMLQAAKSAPLSEDDG